MLTNQQIVPIIAVEKLRFMSLNLKGVGIVWIVHRLKVAIGSTGRAPGGLGTKYTRKLFAKSTRIKIHNKYLVGHNS